jgi:hypothetical protein
MKVVRIEHPSDHYGPYQHGWNPDGWSGDIPPDVVHAQDTMHPLPIDDFATKYRPPWFDMRFGFATVADLWQWFKPYCPYLKGKGYVVASYDVPKRATMTGGHQVAFEYLEATRVDAKPLD